MRRLASMAYESLVVAAILIAAAFPFVGAASAHIAGPLRFLFQAYLALVLGFYFVWCWRRSGQTLPMKAWRLRLVRGDGAPVDTPRAIARYAIAAFALGSGAVAAILLWKQPGTLPAWLMLGPALLDIFWSLVDHDRQFLHDRLTGTRIVSAVPPTTSS